MAEKKSLSNKFLLLFHKARFKDLLLIWLLIIFSFSICYYLLSMHTSFKLIYRGTPLDKIDNAFLNSIYFSFITTTSLGYGDISPLGVSKILAIIEVMVGLLINGLLIAKFVSEKEEVMLEEIYDFTFQNQIDRLRANLYYDRANISSFLTNLSRKYFDAEGLNLLYLNLETHVLDIKEFLDKQKTGNDFTKDLDNYRFYLILKSIELCLERYVKLKTILCEKKLDFDTDSIEEFTESIESVLGDILALASERKDAKLDSKIKTIKKYLGNVCKW